MSRRNRPPYRAKTPEPVPLHPYPDLPRNVEWARATHGTQSHTYRSAFGGLRLDKRIWYQYELGRLIPSEDMIAKMEKELRVSGLRDAHDVFLEKNKPPATPQPEQQINWALQVKRLGYEDLHRVIINRLLDVQMRIAAAKELKELFARDPHGSRHAKAVYDNIERTIQGLYDEDRHRKGKFDY